MTAVSENTCKTYFSLRRRQNNIDLFKNNVAELQWLDGSSKLEIL